MSLNGNFTTRFHTHPSLVFLFCTALYVQKTHFRQQFNLLPWGFAFTFSSRRFASRERKYVILSLFLYACYDTLVLMIQYPKIRFRVSLMPPMNIRSMVFILVQFGKLSFFPLFYPPHLYVYLLYVCLHSSKLFVFQYAQQIWHLCTLTNFLMYFSLHGCASSCFSCLSRRGKRFNRSYYQIKLNVFAVKFWISTHFSIV